MKITKISQDQAAIQRAVSYIQSGESGYLGEIISEAFTQGNYEKLDSMVNNLNQLSSSFGNQNLSQILTNIQLIIDTFGDINTSDIISRLEDIKSTATKFNALDEATKKMIYQLK